jgi:hypothetical protein
VGRPMLPCRVTYPDRSSPSRILSEAQFILGLAYPFTCCLEKYLRVRCPIGKPRNGEQSNCHLLGKLPPPVLPVGDPIGNPLRDPLSRHPHHRASLPVLGMSRGSAGHPDSLGPKREQTSTRTIVDDGRRPMCSRNVVIA